MNEYQLHVGMLLKKLADALDRRTNESMREVGMTRSQVHVLLALSEAEGRTLSFSRLKEQLGVSQPTAWGLVSRLEAKGMVRTSPDPTDARAKLVTMTDEGRETFEVAFARMDGIEGMLTAGLDEGEFFQLKSYLQRISANCEK